MDLMVLSIALVVIFVGIFLTRNFSPKYRIIVFLTAAIILIFGHLLTTHETSGYFYSPGEIRPGQMSITGVGHRPTSILFNIKMVWKDRIIAENVELSRARTSVEKEINGNLFRIGLLSLDRDGFTIHMSNETGYGIVVVWIANYNKLSDFFKKRIILTR